MQSNASVTVLGARGSAPALAAGFQRYGMGTACFLVRLGGEVVVLDAGSGLMELGSFLAPGEDRITVLLSHPHVDHLIGLPLCPVCFDPARDLTLMATPKGGRSARAQVCALMSPPLWPVGPEAFTARVSFRDLPPGTSALGPVVLETMNIPHPGGCTAFRLTYQNLSLVYATDCELTPHTVPPLLRFAKNCSILLCDGQYIDAEIETTHGFGHSTWRMAAQLARDCGAGALRVIHHAPGRTDAALAALAAPLEEVFPGAAFAQFGEEVPLL